MFNGLFHIREPINEPILGYAPGTPERQALKAELQRMLANPVEVPCIIGGRDVTTGDLVEMRPPHNLAQSLGHYHRAGAREAEMAISAANEAKITWSEMDWSSRATVLLKAAELLAGKYRHTLNAATMLNMSKTCHQAEIDAACELIDFWRFNPYFMTEVYDDQPISTKGVLNYMEHRPLEGFVFAVTPFNFVSINGNLPTAPAVMGNVVVWKPASTAIYTSHFINKILRQAGIPDEMVHRPKWQIALELHAWAVANGVRLQWATADEGYGEVPAFHFALDDRGQRYVLEVPCTFHGWLRRPAVLQKQHHSPHKRGPKPRVPRLKAKNLPTLEVRNMVTYCDEFRKQPWEKFHIKDTTKGPEVWEAKAAPVYLKRDGLPTWPHWLIVARNGLNPDEIKYFISNGPAGTPLEVMLHVAFQRFHVERCFEEEKDELGMDHFEVRNYTSLKRHLLLTAVSHLFLAKVRQQWRGEKSTPDGLPTPPGGRGAGALAVADRPGSHELLGPGSPDHQRNPAAERKVRTQPCEGPQAAVA